ncbi:hypothetical protein MBLNU459_g7283t1 [Dothideomycetes sp. NU459]
MRSVVAKRPHTWIMFDSSLHINDVPILDRSSPFWIDGKECGSGNHKYAGLSVQLTELKALMLNATTAVHVVGGQITFTKASISDMRLQLMDWKNTLDNGQDMAVFPPISESLLGQARSFEMFRKKKRNVERWNDAEKADGAEK